MIVDVGITLASDPFESFQSSRNLDTGTALSDHRTRTVMNQPSPALARRFTSTAPRVSPCLGRFPSTAYLYCVVAVEAG